ncbi:MAG: HD domain-containing protein [Lachnospiraceae bacterium]|nr:HD domain-containing protein [Lachnospiraceae bacterium]
MKNIATMALKPGMIIANDVFNYQNELIVSAGTSADMNTLRKLNLYQIMAVKVMEEIDFATTYYEKTRLSQGFIDFNEAYHRVMPIYKQKMINFVKNNVPISIMGLMQIYQDIVGKVENKNRILDYLYNMQPSEDDLTHAHCLNSALIAGVFSHWLGMDAAETDTLVQCGFLYDIGKLKLPYSLIWKPDKLTDVEFMKIKTHTMIGFDMLKDLNLSDHIIKATLQHHERCDGSGYPSKFKGGQISTYAKLIAVIDAYDAMTSARIYRESKHPFQVIKSFEEMGFYKFDEEIIRPICMNIALNMVGNHVLLSNGQDCEIITIKENPISRPIVKNPDGLFLDLSINEHLEIQSIS